MVTVTKKFEFEAAHFLPHYEGACRNLHGHTFKGEVKIRHTEALAAAPVGMIMDFKELKKLIQEKIIDKLDHKCLNDIFEWETTSENLVVWMARQLRAAIGDSVVSIRLYETTNSYAEWTNTCE